MGLFGFFKKKEVSEETRKGFLNKLLTKYFEGSKAKLGADAADLLELTKYEITPGEMATLLIRCLGFRELKGDWNAKTANALRMDCSGKLPDVELKWILVYCDLHYVVKDSAKEALLLFELAGRQMGMPSPHGDISTNYKF
jgi:hypothetical protein